MNLLIIVVMNLQKFNFCTENPESNFKLYFPLAEERKRWKMFSHTPLGPGPEGLFFESHAQCLSVAVLLSAIADVYF